MKELLLLALLAVLVHSQIDIQLRANWESPPFELRLLETVSSENESYFLSTVSKIAGFPLSDEEDVLEYSSDEDLYDAVFDSLTPIESSLYDIPLANKYHSPRIIAHYQHYIEYALPSAEPRLLKKCGEVPKTWLKFNDEVYCNPDDVYALMTDTTKNDILLPFDRIIGSRGPLLFLYGDVKDETFKKFMSNLYDASSGGKLRFAWRYVPQNTTERELLSGYGVDLTLKRTDYIVIDDRDSREGSKSLEGRDHTATGSLGDVYDDDIRAVSKEDLKELGLKISSHVLSLGNNSKQLESLIQIVEELPKYSSYLVDGDINDDLVKQITSNQRFGISSETQGLFLNGKMLEHTKANIFDLYNEIKQELGIIEGMVALGLEPSRSRELVSKFSLLSVYKSRSTKNTRYDITSSHSGSYHSSNPVIFLNDVEKDPVYQSYSEDITTYVGRFAFGQIPQVKSNLQTLIFAVDLSNNDHVSTLNSVFRSVSSNGISQRIGVIPLPLTDKGRVLANNLYHVSKTEPIEKVINLLGELEKVQVSVKELGESDYSTELVEPFMAKFDVRTPTFIVNGILYALDANWVYTLTKQVSEDVNFILGMAYQRIAGSFEEAEKLFYEDSLPFRNTLLFPPEKTDAKYKVISPDSIQRLRELSHTVVEFTNVKDEKNLATLTLAGDFGSKLVLSQLREILNLSEIIDLNLKVRLIHTSDGISFLGRLKQELHESTERVIETVESIISENQFADGEVSISPVVAESLMSMGISSESFILFNGRYVELIGSPIDCSILEYFVRHETDERLAIIQSLLGSNLDRTEDAHDWFESLSSILTTTYYTGESGTVPRYDFDMIKRDVSISFGNKRESMIHMLVVVDPAKELSQKLLMLASVVKELNFISMEVLLVPQLEMDEIQIKRFYKGNFKSSVVFKNGSIHEEPFVSFISTPAKTLFTLDMDVPPSWVVIPKQSISDLDNVILAQSGPVTGIYELESIVIEGNAVDVSTGSPPTGLAVQIPGSDTYVMTNYGYLQLKANPGLWEFTIKEGRSRDLYNLVSVDSAISAEVEAKDGFSLALFNLDGLKIYPRVMKKPGKEDKKLIYSDDEDENDGVENDTAMQGNKQGLLSSWFKVGEKKKQADINIFSVASGHLYERLLSIMTVSVMRHTDHTVKFWLIDNYMSPSFRRFLPHLSKKYGFEYELITYKWPLWLREQREKQRTIWGYKILFLDVLFPQDLDKVIFVDADQIVRADMMELVEMDLHGAPYGYTPMGDSRKEMEGFRFWKQGYWKTFLADTFKYHISALYVIDLKKFRKIAAGDRLRQHYQALSRDPASLSNLDQDLPNNLQPQLKIFSLPQDWLWCETWCDDASLKTAKTIDLCNNPLTKEPKLDRARRQIPEWTVYDDEITVLRDEVLEQEGTEYVNIGQEQDHAQEVIHEGSEFTPEHDEL